MLVSLCKNNIALSIHYIINTNNIPEVIRTLGVPLPRGLSSEVIDMGPSVG